MTDNTRFAQSNTIMSTNLGDSYIPYSFSDWINRNVNVIAGKEKEQYNQYLLNWYKSLNLTKKEQGLKVREDYISLLKQLSIIFKKDLNKYFSEINFDDDADLERIIPYFVKQLKGILIYYINKRETSKRSKLKYNTIGSKSSIERVLYEYILKAFTKRTFPGNEYITSYMDPSAVNLLPSLSSILPKFQIKIDELYDDTSYFDKDPSISASNYFNLSSNSLVEFLTAKGIEQSDFEWLYSTGFAQLCTNNPLASALEYIIADYISNGYPLSSVEASDSTVLNAVNQILLSEKYLGESGYYYATGGYYNVLSSYLTFDFTIGNNWFYWPYGELPYESQEYSYIDPIPLSSTSLFNNGAVAGLRYDQSDVIFVRSGDELKGAWLRLEDYISSTPTMSAKLIKGRTLFRFPYPGYGLSGDGLEWTGMDYENIDLTYYYLDNDTQSDIQNIYWSTSASDVSTFNIISIHDTSLVECSATPSQLFTTSDQIIVRNNYVGTPRNGIYQGEQKYAWLYALSSTDIPISIGKTTILWPYCTYEDQLSGVSALNINMASACAPLGINEISKKYLTGACAGKTISEADIIFRMNAPSGYALEGAWLSGAPFITTRGNTLSAPYNVINSQMTQGVTQPGLSFLSLAGNFTTFLWGGRNTLANNVFKHYEHQSDCNYYNIEHPSIYSIRNEAYENDIAYNQWKWCTCFSIVYSPLGHPGSTFDDYSRMCDYIVAISDPNDGIDLSKWKDFDGNTYKESNQFGWFKLTGENTETDVGWGKGCWITYSGEPFILSANMLYAYYRSNLLRAESDETDNLSAPYYIAKYSYPENYNTKTHAWIKLYYDKTADNWVSDDVESDMELSPGEYYSYIHRNVCTIALTTEKIEINDEIVVNDPVLNFEPLLSALSIPIQTTTIILSTLNTTISAGVSGIEVENSNIPVALQIPTGTTIPIDVGSFTDYLEQLSTPVVTAMSAVSSYITYENTFNLQAINFVLNVPLSGWNYDNCSYDISANGIRPFWAKSTDNDTLETKRKGIDVWGGNARLVNYYTFIKQPYFSDIIFDNTTYVEYIRNNNNVLFWIQPLELHVLVNNAIWSELTFSSFNSANLSSTVIGDISELVISAKNIPSDIILKTKQGDPLLVNYYSMSGVKWVQEVYNSSYGIPPSGGLWVNAVSSQVLNPLAPYANLTNRHYPTYASVPYIAGLYGEKESGGYFVPKMLGTSTYLGKNVTTYLNTTSHNVTGNEIIFGNSDFYAKDQGLTKKDQSINVLVKDYDSSWMKSSITEYTKSGMIETSNKHQSFMPYQTKYETVNYNEYGLYRQNDSIDPWMGEYDNIWSDPEQWKPNFKKQYPIESWYNQNPGSDNFIYSWKTDVFGNSYYLLKTYSELQSMYEKLTSVGEIWTRNAKQRMFPGNISLSSVYDKFTSLISANEFSNIRDIDVWYDILFIRTNYHIFTTRIRYDYEYDVIYTLADDIHWITLSDDHKYCGIWFLEKQKIVHIGTIGLSSYNDNVYFYPKLYTLDLDSNVMKNSYCETLETVNELSGITVYQINSAIEDPIFTFNDEKKLFVYTFLCYSSLSAYENSMFLNVFQVDKKSNDDYLFNSSLTVVPTSLIFTLPE